MRNQDCAIRVNDLLAWEAVAVPPSSHAVADSPDLRNRRAELARMLLAAACTLALVLPGANAETKPLFQPPDCAVDCSTTAPSLQLTPAQGDPDPDGCFPNCNMIDWNYLVNALSGVLLVALGAWAISRRYRLALPVYFMAWGTQIAFTNAATVSQDRDTAFLVFLLSQILLPLQAMLLLNYVVDRARDQAHRVVGIIAKTLAILVALTVLATLIVSLAAPGSVLAIKESNNGDLLRETKPLSSWLIQFPHFMGTALGLGLLAWMRPRDNKDRLLTGALCLAWACATAFVISQGFRAHVQDRVLMGSMEACLVTAALVGPGFLLWRTPRWWRHLPLALLIPLLSAASWYIALGSIEVRAAFGPGAARVVAMALFLPALLSSPPEPLSKMVRLHRAPAWAAVATTFLATAILQVAAASPNLFGNAWKSSAINLAISSLILVGAMGIYQTRNLLPQAPSGQPEGMRKR
jgi:hypothetical protein